MSIKDEYEAIKAALESPPDEPFAGHPFDEVERVIVAYVRTGAVICEEPYIRNRMLAFVIQQSGIMYQELGACIPLHPVTVIEHTFLKRTLTDTLNKMTKIISSRSSVREGLNVG